MNISDAAMEECPLCNFRGQGGHDCMRRVLVKVEVMKRRLKREKAATAALTLELETVKRSRDGLHATLEYGVQTMREVEAERDHYQSTMEQSVTMAESYRIERDQLRQQLAEARDKLRTEMNERGITMFAERQVIESYQTEALDTLNPPTDEK